ncbi:uncharacterized protein LOC144433262 [Glandiceps talaboti]
MIRPSLLMLAVVVASALIDRGAERPWAKISDTGITGKMHDRAERRQEPFRARNDPYHRRLTENKDHWGELKKENQQIDRRGDSPGYSHDAEVPSRDKSVRNRFPDERKANTAQSVEQENTVNKHGYIARDQERKGALSQNGRLSNQPQRKEHEYPGHPVGDNKHASRHGNNPRYPGSKDTLSQNGRLSNQPHLKEHEYPGRPVGDNKHASRHGNNPRYTSSKDDILKDKEGTIEKREAYDCPDYFAIYGDTPYICDDGLCIGNWQECDGVYDCYDKSDEINCETCDGDGDFLCDNGICTSRQNLCNGWTDCGDWSDEKLCDCTLPDTSYCGWNNNNYYYYYDATQCIHNTMICDGYNHCGYDELFCGDRCPGFTCSNGRCISLEYVCDNSPNCGNDFWGVSDMSDEIGCDCERPMYMCQNGPCIYDYQVCDGYNNCGDWSDENNNFEGNICGYGNCSDAFQCDSGQCVWDGAECDGYADCEDKSDEKYCPDCIGFQCENGVCIEHWEVCDNRFDCGGGDASDEASCESCDDGFQCENGLCVERYELCDGTDHCGDFSDERVCECTETSFVCNNGRCVAQHAVCDGYDHCRDYSDERDCAECQGEEFRCDNGMCISESSRCNGWPECGDYSDEINCECSGEYHFYCRNGVCINWWDYYYYERCYFYDYYYYDMYLYDGLSYCMDFSHLIGCDSDCTDESEFLCNDGTCIAAFFQCDGHQHCWDNSDEENCEDGSRTMCCLTPDYGSCYGNEDMWYYDCNEGICSTFMYSGCGGNGNRFDSKETCIEECAADSCCLDPVKGPCNENLTMWYFDPRDNVCKEFIYGGCEGNENKHWSREVCENDCQAFNRNITCEADRMVATISTEWLNEMLPHDNSGPSGYYLNNENCTGKGVYIGGKEYYQFSTGLQDCGTTSIERIEDDRIVFTNIVYSESEGGLEIIEMECCYETLYEITIKVITNPCSVLVTLRGFGTFNVTASLYDSDAFLTLFDEADFPLRICKDVLIYFGIHVELNINTLELFIENCYATESEDPHANVDRHYMITDGCIGSEVTEFAADSLTKHFAWAAYDVVNRDGVVPGQEIIFYIHCEVHVCRKYEVGTRCSMGCIPARKRRSTLEMKGSAGSTSTFITHGPIKKSDNCGH